MATLPDLSTPAAFKAAVKYDGPVEQRQREGKTLEMKHPAILDEENKSGLLHTLVAFANTSGGSLVIGVGEQEDEAGERYADGLYDVPNSNQVIEQLQNQLNDRAEPGPRCEAGRTIIDDKQVVWFQVWPSMSIVAVRKRAQKKNRGSGRGKRDEYGVGKSLLFPYRTAHGTAYMGAKQVENHILNPYRVRRLELEAAMARGPVFLAKTPRLLSQAGDDSYDEPLVVRSLQDAYLEAVNPREWDGAIVPSLVYLPYQVVTLVMPTPRGGTLVHIEGSIYRYYDDNDDPFLEYAPPSPRFTPVGS